MTCRVVPLCVGVWCDVVFWVVLVCAEWLVSVRVICCVGLCVVLFCFVLVSCRLLCYAMSCCVVSVWRVWSCCELCC